MNKLMKAVKALTGIFLAVMLTACFDATRNNPNDPKSDNYSGGGTLEGTLIRVTPAEIDFGDVEMGTQSTLDITIENISPTETLEVTNITTSAPMAFPIDTAIFSYTIEPGGDPVNIPIRFNPQVVGSMSETITIESNDPMLPQAYVTVTGNGVTGTVTPEYDYYVSANTGADGNTGTSPGQAIQSITRLLTLNPPDGSTIAFAGGTYSVSQDFILAGHQLYGGFDASTWNNANRMSQSIINDTRTGGDSGNPIGTIVIQGGSNDTIIDGFTINSGAGFSCAVKLDTDSGTGYTAYITNNIINGLTTSGQQFTYGIYNYNDTAGAGATTIYIDSNTIYGGNSNGAAINCYSRGIYIYSMVADTITYNIWNNCIDGGTAIATTMGNPHTFGICLIGYVYPKIFNNTIYNGTYGQGATSTEYYTCGIYCEGGAQPSIINNIIFGKDPGIRYGIMEADLSSDPTELKNNCFYQLGPMYRDCIAAASWNDMITWNNNRLYDGGNYIDSIVDSDCISGAVYFIDFPNDWHLTSGSISGVLSGGLDLLGQGYMVPGTDKAGVTRTGDGTTGWSMGAYEY